MDLEQEISKALADPEIMSKVQSVVSSLSNKEETDSEAPTIPPALFSKPGGGLNDDRTRLLMAIKPFLSEKRAPYMDSALAILKFASIGKLGKDLNLF